MKNLIYLPFAAVLISCSANRKSDSFELSGQFANTNNETIYLDRLAGPQPEPVDSAEIDDEGNFSFENYIPQPGFYRIRQSQQNFAMLVLDTSDKVRVTGNLGDLGNTYKVEGSEETKLFLEYNDIIRRRDLRLDSINSMAQTMMEPHRMNAAKMDSLTATFEVPYNEITETANRHLEQKILANADKYASIMPIQSLEPDRFSHVYKELSEGLKKKFPNDQTVASFHDYVNRVLRTAVGQEAPDIRLPSPGGEELALSSYRGKVVLIDFWASWCGPCRREMPSVVKAYNAHKNKGFEIFGVSLDKDKARWIEAIKSDGMTWPQVSDLQHWQSAAAQLYNVQSIPYTVLVGRDGKIVAKNLRGEELDRKLTEVLNAATGAKNKSL